MVDITQWEIIEGGVTAPAGFLAAGAAAGIKGQTGKKDVALLFSETPAAAAAVFTTNLVKAAPLLVTADHLKHPWARAVVINSGNANACTGEAGLLHARQTAAAAAAALGIREEEVLVASTGVIGVPLPVDRVCQGVRQCARQLARDGGAAAAEAIMTTDTRRKELTLTVNLAGAQVTIGAMAKGSGMIHPNLATMLALITTDAAIGKEPLQAALTRAAGTSFNMVTVDGDTSTNDLVLALANGRAGNRPMEPGSEAYDLFAAALAYLCQYLAREIARDGEGASKLVTVRVEGARADADARLAAKAVAGSSLVKTAMAGADANWGRILAAVGYSGAVFDPAAVDIFFAGGGGEVQVCARGAGLAFDEAGAREILQKDEVTIRVALNQGDAGATAWTCDLTEAYVRINADYRT